jgi:hypothetical protein
LLLVVHEGSPRELNFALSLVEKRYRFYARLVRPTMRIESQKRKATQN